MAVVQISRIQVRRGKANSGTGIPQLASGELAWAIDNQQLYIGNGSVAEGSPAVGNTKILTENDLSAQGNILNLIQHIYKSGESDSVQTGPTLLDPIERKLQDRLDDRVTLLDFLPTTPSATDTTEALQRAIDQLYINPVSRTEPSSRVVLEIPAGRYIINSTIYIPSYATLLGAGAECTIIQYDGSTGPAFKFVNDDSEIGNPASINTTVELTQPKFITIKDLTVFTTSDALTGLQLDAVADSIFENLSIEGEWDGAAEEASRGIELNASPIEVAPTQRNLFKNVRVTGFKYAFFAKDDIAYNNFEHCTITNAWQGFAFGNENLGGSIGNTTGPVNNNIDTCYFENIKKQAVYIERGRGNNVTNCKLQDVGNDGGGHVAVAYPQIYFNTSGNYVKGLNSDRAAGLSNSILNRPYMPEVSGRGEFESFGTRTVNLSSLNPPLDFTEPPLFRLPIPVDDDGNPNGSIVYTINYVYRSSSERITRAGTMTVSADIYKTYISTGGVQLVDEYNYVGPVEEETTLQFSVALFDDVGTKTTGANDSIPYNIGFYYINDAGGGGTFQYSYKAVF